MKTLQLLTASGTKSIPLHAWPSEAFTSIIGDNVGGGSADVMTYYESVPWLYRGTNARADAMANIPFCYEVNGKDQEDYELPFKLHVDHLINQLEGDLTLYGAAYVWLDKESPTPFKKIERLLPTTIKPKYEDKAGLAGWKRTVNGKVREFDLDEIGYIWLPNRKRELGPGIPPAVAALQAAGVLRYIDMFNNKFFEDGTMMPLVIGIDDATPETDVQRIESWLSRRMTGIKNAFAAIAIRGGINPQILGQNDLSKLAMGELSNSKREDIATALGVPHSLLFSNAANYATANQDALNWYEMTIIPESKRIEDALNEQLFEPLAGVSFAFKPDRLEMFQAREADKAIKLVTLYKERILSKNEVREQAGYEPIEGGDEIEEPQPPPPQLMPPAQPQGNPEPDEDDSEKAFFADLKRWKTKALRRLKEGKSLAVEFTSDYIDGALASAIDGALEASKTAADVSRVFSDAKNWSTQHG